MRFITNFNSWDFADSLAALVAAFVFGTLIGAERQYRQRDAGLRTNVLVSIGAATFVDLGMRLTGSDSAARIVANIATGVGFLGAGVIMKEGTNIRGLNTAATLWCSAAVGACAGADMIAQAALVTLATISGNTLLRPVVNMIDRIPFNERQAEATYEVTALVAASAAADVRGWMSTMLEAGKFPVRDIDEELRADGVSSVVATLIAHSVDPRELDEVVNDIARLPGVAHATWSGSSKD